MTKIPQLIEVITDDRPYRSCDILDGLTIQTIHFDDDDTVILYFTDGTACVIKHDNRDRYEFCPDMNFETLETLDSMDQRDYGFLSDSDYNVLKERETRNYYVNNEISHKNSVKGYIKHHGADWVRGILEETKR